MNRMKSFEDVRRYAERSREMCVRPPSSANNASGCAEIGGHMFVSPETLGCVSAVGTAPSGATSVTVPPPPQTWPAGSVRIAFHTHPNPCATGGAAASSCHYSAPSIQDLLNVRLDAASPGAPFVGHIVFSHAGMYLVRRPSPAGLAAPNEAVRQDLDVRHARAATAVGADEGRDAAMARGWMSRVAGGSGAVCEFPMALAPNDADEACVVAFFTAPDHGPRAHASAMFAALAASSSGASGVLVPDRNVLVVWQMPRAVAVDSRSGEVLALGDLALIADRVTLGGTRHVWHAQPVP